MVASTSRSPTSPASPDSITPVAAATPVHAAPPSTAVSSVLVLYLSRLASVALDFTWKAKFSASQANQRE